MARALRIEIQGGHYHATARGNERRAIFRQDKDRTHFLELLSELAPRFGVRLHAYVLMPSVRRMLGQASWKEIVQAVERLKDEQWEILSKRHGDWGRDAVLWLGRYAGRMRLAELAALVGNCDYTTVVGQIGCTGDEGIRKGERHCLMDKSDPNGFPVKTKWASRLFSNNNL